VSEWCTVESIAAICVNACVSACVSECVSE
jgi:hypothetical protein